MANKKKLSSIFQYFLVGGSVFAMHFGGSSMVWPMTWGKESGISVYIVFLGIFITAIALVYAGYLSLVNSGKSMYQMAEDVSVPYAYLFSGIIILVMGPLFCIPRMSAASWSGILQASHYSPKTFMPALVFSIAYYLLTYWFICDKNGIIDKLSKVLLPVLIIAVSGIIIKAFIYPIGMQEAPVYSINPFAYGFKSGYATGEVVCSLLFGNIIIDGLKAKGIEKDYLNRNLKIVCLIGLATLTITHFGHMYTGSHASGTEFQDLRYSALYTQVVIKLWGKIGGIIFNVALMFAALTTAVGLSAATAGILQEVFKDKINYKTAAKIILIISACISAIGLGTIVEAIGPLLDIIYPATIVMVLYYSIIKKFTPKVLNTYRYAMIVSLIFGVLEGIITYGKYFKINISRLENILNYIPLTNIGLSWLIPVGIAILVGALKSGNN